MTTYALHGFLGLPGDWDRFARLTAVDLWEGEILPFQEWAQAFNQEYEGHLIGYSLGGRLALHALIDNPDQWESAVIISAHPGLIEKEQRLATDEYWAKRFESAPWDQLMQEWNSQSVFTCDAAIERNDVDYDRKKLAQALRLWSLGAQDNLFEPIQKLPTPILWVTGERDVKFTQIARTLTFRHPQSKALVVPNAGHRVPWHQPEILKTLIEEWKNDCNAHANMDICRTI